MVFKFVNPFQEILSNQACSLRPNEEKYTFSAVFTINKENEIKNQWFGRTVILSDQRLAYEEAQHIIETQTQNIPQEISLTNQSYTISKPLVDAICTMNEMAKKIVGYIKLQIPAGKANPSPPVGPALGQRGLNIMEFCKAFNAATQTVEPGLPIPVVITAFADKSFTFVMKTPPASILIKKAAKLEKGSPRPHTDKVGKITRAQAEEIAKTKMADLTASDMDAAVRTIAGSARSMGIEVEGV